MLNESPGIYCQKGQTEQVCDEIVYFAVSFAFLHFHKRLGHALYCSSLFVINFHSSYHQGSLTSQFPKLEKGHKLHLPPTLAFSRLKWLLLQLLPSSIPRPAVRADKIQRETEKAKTKPEQKDQAKWWTKLSVPQPAPCLGWSSAPTETKNRWFPSSVSGPLPPAATPDPGFQGLPALPCGW